jgi:predicted cupin superfamily sugar epimerase
LKATYPPSKPDLSRETEQTRALISHLNLQPHIEGGYFVETDRDERRVPNPFLGKENFEKERMRKPETEIGRERESANKDEMRARDRER